MMRMLRLRLRILIIGAALTIVPGAAAAVELKNVSVTPERTVNATVVTSTPTTAPPVVTENGGRVAGLVMENLGRAKSISLLIDRSQSMHGRPLADASAAARAFIAAKPAPDRIQVIAFATHAVALTGFSSSTIDADGALRTLAVDPVAGTKLYDAVVLAAGDLSSEPLPARVIILVTDGNETRSSATLEEAIAAARAAGAVVYPIAIQSLRFNPAPLKELAAKTGGTYFSAASSAALQDIYSSIAAELTRTWRFQYATAAVPGERIRLDVRADGETVTAPVEVPGQLVETPAPKPRLPRSVLTSPGGPLFIALGAGLAVLLAVAFLGASKKGMWVRNRLAPHVAPTERVAQRRGDRERLAFAAGMFRATERAFGHLRQWQALQRTLERADIPLRTVEFVYIMAISAVVLGFLGAAAGGSVAAVVCFLGGGLLPYGFIAFKARKRIKLFENQLPDLLVTMAASLKAGHSFRQGIQTVVDEGQEPASKEFQRVLTETRLGRPMDEALAEMTRRVGSKNFDFVISAVTIQRQIGGSLASLFDMVADTVRQRQQFQRKIKGLTAMGRMSAYVLIGLPFFVLGTVTLINAEYMDPLYHSSTGHKLMIGMLVMMAIGSLILRKIVSFKA